MIRRAAIAALLLLPLACGAADLAALSADRAVIERVYHTHRTGTKKPFEETMPPLMIGQWVRTEAHKEALLKRAYGVEITPAMVEAEAQRINTTTRAPEILAEIKHALGDDPARFARSMARPIVVERLLRGRYDNDDTLHAPQRQAMDALRTELLAAKSAGQAADALLAQIQGSAKPKAAEVSESVWLLTPRPPEAARAQQAAQPGVPTTVKAQAGVYSVEATAQVAQTLAAPDNATPQREEKPQFYFEDLPGELQNVLRVQLRNPGDVSAVIEMPGGFTLYLTREKSATQLAAAVVTLRKRAYEQWLEERSE
ncbi:MAG: hypothetical protein WCP45_09320 [Verrucomicrobiota bacterium]